MFEIHLWHAIGSILPSYVAGLHAMKSLYVHRRSLPFLLDPSISSFNSSILLVIIVSTTPKTRLSTS
ncbi:hypothetical protein HanRHA438_Chr05g0230291 [Helianthus annuus]|nr:hypothetical protein HanRHA438_Chr05g0230291 [Helianthus annuus]